MPLLNAPPPSVHEYPRAFIVHNRHEHIQAAALCAVGTHGYDSATVEQICETAHISAKSFHKHFATKEEVVLSGVEAGADQLMGLFHEIFRTCATWPDAVWDALEAFAEWCSAEPEFARTALVEVMAAGLPAVGLRDSLLDAFALFLEPGYELLDPADHRAHDIPVTRALVAQLHQHISQEGPGTLASIVPDLTRITLTPFLGEGPTEQFIARRQAGY